MVRVATAYGEVDGEGARVVGVVGGEDLAAVVDGGRAFGGGRPAGLEVPVEEERVELAGGRGLLDELEEVGGVAVFGGQGKRCVVVRIAYFGAAEPVHVFFQRGGR